MKKLIALCAVATLAACTPKYAPPLAGPMASVTFTAGPALTGGYAYITDRECRNRERLGNFAQPSGVILRSLSEGRETFTTTLAADRTASLQLDLFQPGAMGSTQCTVTIEFDPIQGEKYEVVFDAAARRCTAQMYRLAGVSRQREPSARAAAKQCPPSPD